PEDRGLAGESVGHDLVDGAVDALVRLLPQPPLGHLVQMRPALEGAVADEEVVFDIADIPLVLPLGLGPGGAAGPGHKSIVAGQIHEARMEANRASARMCEDGALLIVDQDLAGAAAEPLEGADHLAGEQRPVGRLIALQLPPRLRLEADRRPPGPQRAL